MTAIKALVLFVSLGANFAPPAIANRPASPASIEIKAPDSAPAGTGFAVQAEVEGVKGLFWLVFPISEESRLVRIPSFPEGEVNPLIYLGGLPSGELNFVGVGVTTSGKAIGASKTVKIGDGPRPIPPGPQPPGPNPPNPNPPVPVPPAPVPDRYGLAAKVKEWTSSVTDSDKALHCKQIASFLDDVTKGINDGSLRDEDAVLKQLAGIRSIFSQWPYITQGRWMFLRSSLLNELDKIFPKDKSPHPVANYAQAFSELSAGLKGVQ
jgi:hypothetical protein